MCQAFPRLVGLATPHLPAQATRPLQAFPQPEVLASHRQPAIHHLAALGTPLPLVTPQLVDQASQVSE